jgi:hypothetical protein
MTNTLATVKSTLPPTDFEPLPSDLVAVNFELEDGLLLLYEVPGNLAILNATAASIWRGWQAGMTSQQIAFELASRTLAEHDQILQDCGDLINRLRDIATQDSESPKTEEIHSTPHETQNYPGDSVSSGSLRQSLPISVTYRLLDLTFQIRVACAADADRVNELLGHLVVSPDRNVDTVFDIDISDSEVRLFQDGALASRCDEIIGLVPMLHAQVLMSAYQAADCLAGIHAAMVSRGDSCVLMPGVSGSGKSTLTTALLSHGFDYGTDDLLLLTSEPIRVRPLSTRIGLKEGAWPLLRGVWPELLELPIHQRTDSKLIRYFLPEAAALKSAARSGSEFATRCVVFPSYCPTANAGLFSISTGDALLRLTGAGYDLDGNLDSTVVQSLLDWLSEIPCYDLYYGDLKQAIQGVEAAMS